MTTDALIIKGDCLNVMAGLPDGSIDAIVTDPPYGLSFMGKNWDHSVPGEAFWREALRVAKPGCHLLAAGGSRTYHRLAVAIEDAGWEIRDCVMWLYGSGFPKSLDVSKAIDKAAGAEREVVGKKSRTYGDNPASGGNGSYGSTMHGIFTDRRTDHERMAITAPATDAARQWQGWGTALKPAFEPFILARKPLDGTVAENVLKHGTGGINVDGCRVEGEMWKAHRATGLARHKFFTSGTAEEIDKQPHAAGRWPANVIHDGSDEVVGLAGDAARFFYTAKASRDARSDGNTHPTVKPTDLMRYLCRLVTPPGGLILDPFCGSGSTGAAAMREGFNFIGIELNAEYAEIARRRIGHERNKTPLFLETA